LWGITMCFVLVACRKKDTVSEPPAPAVNDLLMDSALDYSRDIYLWNEQIPAAFDADEYDDLNELMFGIRQFSEEPGFSGPVDDFSFAATQEEWDALSNGVLSDFGLSAFFFSDNDLRVRSVEVNSPAGKAGIRRGWKIVGVDGSADVTTDNADELALKIYESPSTAFTFERPDGSTVNITLNAETYQEDPIYLDTVYTAGSRKAGYIVFNSFLGDTGKVNGDFARIFSEFVQEGVTDVIIDLRYNGGGYVTMQEKLANYLIRSSANNTIMMTQQFNSNFSALNEVTVFRKLGSLNVSNIYFIVSDNTASASELLINNMKPYMNVKVVGPTPTYGKPVGFFPVAVGDWYIFPVSFRSTNGRNEGNFFDGIDVDQPVEDGLDKDWGDTAESSLAAVLGQISTGSYAAAPPAAGLNSVLESHKRDGNNRMKKGFRGAIEVR